MHNFVDRSGGTQLWVPTDKWGPFRDEIITISYGMGHMFLLLKEEVGGLMQGAVTRFPLEFDTGAMRGVFHPNSGQLYTCGLYGWAGNKTKPGGLYRVRYTGKPAHMPNELHFVQDGVVLGFTDPLAPDSATDPGNYDVKAWNYHWTVNYGSPDFKLNGQEGRDTWTVKSATLSADHKLVFLKVPAVQRVMQLHIAFHLRAENGGEIENFVHGTIHNLGGKTGADCLGSNAIVRAVNSVPRLSQEASGLVQSFSHMDNLSQQDIRIARLPALFVPTNSVATPFLDKGRFRCRWEGFLKLPLNDEMTFTVEGEGSVTLKIDGHVILDAPDTQLTGVRSQPVSLRGGLNRFELDYQSPPKAPAQLRVAWSSKRVSLEPVPPTAFVHEAEQLRERMLAREGRQLFADYRCARCHQPGSTWPATAMPELAADAPAFDGIGNRLTEDWLAKWLLDPGAIRPDTTMPRLLSGSNAGTDAASIAAYLAGLQSGHRDASSVPLGHDPQAGATLFTDLGCIACHRVPGELVISNDLRVSLAHVAAKWKPDALMAFLQVPTNRYHWTRMPDFKLSAAESSTLATFLLDRCRSVPAATTAALTAKPASADPRRGEALVSTLGCLNCHDLEQSRNRSVAPSLADLERSDWRRGCLAEDAAQRGRAPDFSWTPAQRTALRIFAGDGFPSALFQDTPAEFAARQYETLRCQACHPRDDQTDLLTQLKAAMKPAATKDDDDSASAGTVHLGRPPLTFAGEKLYAGWMQQFLAGTLPYKPRPALQGRMPAFPEYAKGLAVGLAQQHGYPAESAPTPRPDPGLAAVGRRLTEVSGGFSCISCHDVGAQKALAGKDTATVNFACIAERLRPSYYWRYVQDPPHLLPGTMMPKFIGEDGTTAIKIVFNGDPQKQFGAIWQYLLSLSSKD
jgi:cytochrome c2